MDAPLRKEFKSDDTGRSTSPAPRRDDQFKQSSTVRAWRIAFLVVCTVGALLSMDLLRLHVKVHTNPNYHAYCAVNEYVDCEEVALSDYAVFGGLPVALWGLLGYLFMGGLNIWGLHRHPQPATWPFGLLFALSSFSVAVSLVMFIISHFLIQSLCIVCTAIHVTNLVLCGLAIAELRKRGSTPFSALPKELRQMMQKKRPAVVYALAFFAAVIVLWLVVPAYWRMEASTGPGGLRVGQIADGAHWIGARKPAIEIVEFSDYQCPYCLRGHAEVRSLVEMVPEKIRLVHRHFPLRSHPEAFNYAMLAHCAGRHHRFWEANDYLFANGRRKNPVTADELAAQLRLDPTVLKTCLADDAARQAIADDVRKGRALRVKGTPTFVIGDKNYPGRIPASVFEAFLSESNSLVNVERSQE